jgi:tellurite resistance protein
MPKQNTRNRPGMTQAANIAGHLEGRDDELLDAVITAAALVARADGRIELVERDTLVDFMDRNGFLFAFARTEIVDAFEHRLRQFEEHGGAEVAVDSLERFAGRAPARLVIDVGWQVATADGHFHSRELHLLHLIHIALLAPSSRSV